MDDTDIPQYFICPISLQIMRDPVIAITGITYDRSSIEHWLLTAKESTCPLTKQPLSRDSDMTPNHTLRRLIQSWCTINAIERFPTPKSPLSMTRIHKLHRDLNVPKLFLNSLNSLEFLVSESEKNKKCMIEFGTAVVMIRFIVKCFRESRVTGLDQAFRILQHTWTPCLENKKMVNDNIEFIEAVVWAFKHEIDSQTLLKKNAALILNSVISVASSRLLERLNPYFFKEVANMLRERISPKATKAILDVLLQVCPWGRNKVKIIEEGVVQDLIELELMSQEKHVTELIIGLLANLCSCADGRAQLLKHAGGIALLTKRMLRVSAGTDEHVIKIVGSIAKYSGTNEVVLEMLSVGCVAKLCMVLQADCAPHLKKKVRDILRLHSNVWNNSPCVDVYLLTRYVRTVKVYI